MLDKKYMSIVSHYESCLRKFGDSHKGVDWPDKKDVETRYNVMLDLIKSGNQSEVSLLDFGCGASHLYEYILKNDMSYIDYSGLDISKDFIQLSKEKYPLVNFYCLDILDSDKIIDPFDYAVLNGVFTEKRGMTFDEMLAYFKSVVVEVFSLAKSGIAFNVMSSHVDWERDDLFHLSLDILAEFLVKHISRDFIIRNDYGLYEYTVYVYK
jgi:SAM-dependent methyltransferase